LRGTRILGFMWESVLVMGAPFAGKKRAGTKEDIFLKEEGIKKTLKKTMAKGEPGSKRSHEEGVGWGGVREVALEVFSQKKQGRKKKLKGRAPKK